MIRFNTSHVVVYRIIRLRIFHIFRFQYISCCSLSDRRKPQNQRIERFQYISCCSLSYKNIPFVFVDVRFNTSHVVVYHKFFIAEEMPYKFQYISCCSLSTSDFINFFFYFLFQYISCCSLSPVVCWSYILNYRFNTSHVVVYLFLTGAVLKVLHRFNTSHVVVYHLYLTKE